MGIIEDCILEYRRDLVTLETSPKLSRVSLAITFSGTVQQTFPTTSRIQKYPLAEQKSLPGREYTRIDNAIPIPRCRPDLTNL